jgi:hypothetical protein
LDAVVNLNKGKVETRRPYNFNHQPGGLGH